MINQGRGTGHRGEWCLKHPRSKDMSGFFLQRDFFYLFNFENEQNTCKPENFENRSAVLVNLKILRTGQQGV